MFFLCRWFGHKWEAGEWVLGRDGHGDKSLSRTCRRCRLTERLPTYYLPRGCKAWRGQDDAGNPIDVIYYGYYGWPSRCVFFFPGTFGYGE